ncbi:manganese efflux pump MntP [Ornithinibacillus halotolerans]|uniref:Putative manganese efflux pump MntP n=1 Tax=Ornithinibacillus halotolerans TaxID=1274357 RepID=A0A916W436_9BACI|nr:manganese efflux pump [Ornithinibacillus halotolerans]GGA64239.1 putative manganese efflux pump MntP [Ornithinibacillus halotolerans]
MGELISIIVMATAIGMDAFSVSLGLGMQRIRLKRIAFIGIIIGLFHIIMPFLGIVVGKFISAQIGDWTLLAGGLLLFGIGAHMLFSAFNREEKKVTRTTGIGLIILGLSVSIDSFSVGLSLGLSGMKTALMLIAFGLASMVLTWIGMLIGRKVHGILGAYGEILGGSILCGFGLYILF